MPRNPIVITLNIAEDFRTRLLDRLETSAFDQFGFEARKETLGLRIVITVSFAAHRLPKPIDIQQSPVFDRSVLRAAVGMNDRAAPNQTAISRPVKSINDELRRYIGETCQPTILLVYLS